jgi:predicted nucleic acid-binding protein
VGKCYLNEADSAAVRELAGSANNINSSSLCIAELACALHRKVREGSLEQKAATKLADFFLDDLANERWQLVPVTDRILRQVELLTRSLPKSTPIRAADAIHILSAVETGFHEIWTNDRQLLAATVHFGLRGRSVKSP